MAKPDLTKNETPAQLCSWELAEKERSTCRGCCAPFLLIPNRVVWIPLLVFDDISRVTPKERGVWEDWRHNDYLHPFRRYNGARSHATRRSMVDDALIDINEEPVHEG